MVGIPHRFGPMSLVRPVLPLSPRVSRNAKNSSLTSYRLEQAQAIQKRFYDASHRLVAYQVGD